LKARLVAWGNWVNAYANMTGGPQIGPTAPTGGAAAGPPPGATHVVTIGGKQYYTDGKKNLGPVR
jgi:hypothetical protein